MSAFEDALRLRLLVQTGEDWPVTAYVVYAITTDPETMRMEEPEWVTPDGQPAFVTRGLIEQARDELSADVRGMFSYVDTEDDEDYDD